MSPTTPHQPLLLRLLHSAIALLVFGSLITGFMVYDRFDKRFGTINLPIVPNTQGIHGTIALTFLILLPIFAIYCFHIGDRRLVQSASIQQLSQQLSAFRKPIWWITLQRLTNTLTLIAATLAVITGRMMQEIWLPTGELNHIWYIGHLISWLLMILSVALHLLMNAKIGGIPLLLSIYHWHLHESDRPQNWLKGFKIKPNSPIALTIELIVIGGIAIAFLLPLLTQPQ